MVPDEAEFLNANEHASLRRHVGQLLWLSGERPDMQFAVKRLTQVLTGPTVGDQLALKRVGRYLLGTLETELMYTCPAGSPADGEDLLRCYELDLTEDELHMNLKELDFKEKTFVSATHGRDCSTTFGVIVGLSMIVQATSASVESATTLKYAVTWMDYVMFFVSVFALFGSQGSASTSGTGDYNNSVYTKHDDIHFVERCFDRKVPCVSACMGAWRLE